jgi:hypothetical protein
MSFDEKANIAFSELLVEINNFLAEYALSVSPVRCGCGSDKTIL